MVYAASFIANICTRKTDMLCRYGGEEFAVILPNSSLKEAAVFSNKICKAFSDATFYNNNQLIPLRVSIGVAAVDGLDASKELS